MSTLFNGSSEVESYVYQDTDGNVCGAEVPASPDAQPKAKPATRDNVPRISEEEISRLISEARAEGMREGEARGRASLGEDIAREHARTAEIVAAFQKERKEYYSRVEVELVHFALAIAAKILHREAQVDRMVVAGLVKIALDKLQQGTRVMVRIRPDSAELWRQYFHDNPTVQVAEDSSLSPQDCVLETEMGTVHMGLDAQLKEIEKGFFDLLAQKPEVK